MSLKLPSMTAVPLNSGAGFTNLRRHSNDYSHSVRSEEKVFTFNSRDEQLNAWIGNGEGTVLSQLINFVRRQTHFHQKTRKMGGIVM